MTSFERFYDTIPGRMITDGAIGLALGLLIWWWRGNALAPFLCSSPMALMGYLRLRRTRQRKIR